MLDAEPLRNYCSAERLSQDGFRFFRAVVDVVVRLSLHERLVLNVTARAIRARSDAVASA